MPSWRNCPPWLRCSETSNLKSPRIMNILSTIIAKVFGKSEPAAPATPEAAVVPAAAAAVEPFDVTSYLDNLAAANKEKLDWKKSIVDLMKLVGMDSSFTARKALAAELNYTGDTGDSAGMNIWLHKQVLQKIAQNGGQVPADLLD